MDEGQDGFQKFLGVGLVCPSEKAPEKAHGAPFALSLPIRLSSQTLLDQRDFFVREFKQPVDALVQFLLQRGGLWTLAAQRQQPAHQPLNGSPLGGWGGGDKKLAPDPEIPKHGIDIQSMFW
jgi:hypothetical protein